MKVLPNMVNMARKPEDYKDNCPSPVPENTYPYGLCISLTDVELAKLNLDDDGVEVGDMVHLFAMCKVTSVSSNDTEAGKKMRVELQITDIATENEDDENEAVDEAEDVKPSLPALKTRNPYKY